MAYGKEGRYAGKYGMKKIYDNEEEEQQRLE